MNSRKRWKAKARIVSLIVLTVSLLGTTGHALEGRNTHSGSMPYWQNYASTLYWNYTLSNTGGYQTAYMPFTNYEMPCPPTYDGYGYAPWTWNPASLPPMCSENNPADSRRTPAPAAKPAVPAVADPKPEKETAKTVPYIVGKGDTLFRIAEQFDVSVQAIIMWNTLEDPDVLRIGQKLEIPMKTAGPAIPSGKVVKVLSTTLTAYTAGYESTGKSPSHPAYGITFSGKKAKEGRTIAVDPDIIPLGTTVFIEGIGVRTAEDIGSAIQGNRIDVFMTDLKKARKFGVKKNVKVYVISKQSV